MSQAPDSALIVFAHGSRIAEANQAVEAVAERAAAKSGFTLWRAAFLELAEPDLASAVADLYAAGARRIVVTPYFLVMGIHLQRDLPKLLDEARAGLNGLQLDCTPPLDGHPALAEILAQRAAAVIAS